MREVDIFGVLVSPFAVHLLVAALVFVPLKVGLDRAGLDRIVVHRPLVDVALFVCCTALVVAGARLAWGGRL